MEDGRRAAERALDFCFSRPGRPRLSRRDSTTIMAPSGWEISGFQFLAILATFAIVTFGGAALLSIEPKRRTEVVPPNRERVLLLGCSCEFWPSIRLPVRIDLSLSAGIGKEVALSLVARGASVCLVARRAEELAAVKRDCEEILLRTPVRPASYDGRRPAVMRSPEEVDLKVLAIVGDVTSSDDMIRVRDAVQAGSCLLSRLAHFRTTLTAFADTLSAVSAWHGLDTVYIVAGVSSTRAFLDIAGCHIEPIRVPEGATAINRSATNALGPTSQEGIDKVGLWPPPALTVALTSLSKAVAVARSTMEVNYLGPVRAYATFLPLLSTSSAWPVCVNVSSVASSIGAPTRSLYAASKAASLMLTSCECPLGRNQISREALTPFLDAGLAMESSINGSGTSFISVRGSGMFALARDC